MKVIKPQEKVIIGIPAAPGIAIGKLFVFRHDDPVIIVSSIHKLRIDKEISRFNKAVDKSHSQLTKLYRQMVNQVGDAAARIFEAQTVMLKDELFTGEIRNSIAKDQINAEATVKRVSDRWEETISSLDGDLFRQKAQDIHDVGLRLIKNLLGTTDHAIGPLTEPAILVADNLMPSDIARLVHGNVLAVATDVGSATSHTVILTRSLQVPAVVGLNKLSGQVQNGDRIIINGNNGTVIINPTDETLQIHKAKQEKYQHYVSGFADILQLPAITKDGRRIILRANIELPHEVESVFGYGAEGVGLYRSEYLFLSHGRLPDEQEQYDNYCQAIEAVAPNPVTIRTMDLGGDKVFTNLPHPVEANPFLGWRAIRVSLDEPSCFRTQLRAILRAATVGPTRIMFPFISGVSEVRQAKAHLSEVKAELIQEKIPFGNVSVGVMIELPSAVLMADQIAKEVDFFSIGTNDLTQFTLAVDRTNVQVQNRYNPLHPAMIKLIQMTVEAGHKAGIEVGICGELAANPLATLLLVGLDLDEFSISPIALPQIKKLIRSISYSDAIKFAEVALTMDTVEDLYAFCENAVKARFADLPLWLNGKNQI